MDDQRLAQSDLVLYQTEDGRPRIQCRFEEETVWLSLNLRIINRPIRKRSGFFKQSKTNCTSPSLVKPLLNSLPSEPIRPSPTWV